MWRNRAAYGAVVVCAVLFYSFYFGYLSFFFLILTALLPVLSLLYSLPLFWKCTATLSAPVSYTHLDVYKRQGPRGLEFKSPYSDHIAADEMFAAIFCFLWHRNAVPDRNPVLY